MNNVPVLPAMPPYVTSRGPAYSTARIGVVPLAEPILPAIPVVLPTTLLHYVGTCDKVFRIRPDGFEDHVDEW